MEPNKQLTAEEILDKHGRLISGPALQAMEEYASQWKSKYDQLEQQAIEEIADWVKRCDELKAENAALKEKAEKMKAALEQVLSLAPIWEYQPPVKKEHEYEAWALSEMKRKADEALTTYSENKEDTI